MEKEHERAEMICSDCSLDGWEMALRASLCGILPDGTWHVRFCSRRGVNAGRLISAAHHRRRSVRPDSGWGGGGHGTQEGMIC